DGAGQLEHAALGASHRGRGARARTAREEPRRVARGEAGLSQLPRDGLGRRRGLPLRQARAVTAPRSRGRTRPGTQAVPRREADPARPSDLRPLMAPGGSAAELAAFPLIGEGPLPQGLMQEVPLTLDLVLRRLESVGAELPVTSVFPTGAVHH